MPKISVLIPTFNASRYLQETLDSVLSQEGVDFEVIVLDDRSTDNTADMVRERQDPRIRLHVNEANLGTPNNVNQGLAMASGEYIARIDHDDIALPGRLAAQARALDARPELTVIGTQLEHFDDHVLTSNFPLNHDEITARFIGGYAYIANPTVMFRTEFVKKNRIFYDPNLYVVDDLGFFYDCLLKGARFANLPDVFLKYRIHDRMTSKNLDANRLFDSKYRLYARILPRFFPNITGEEFESIVNIYDMYSGDFPIRGGSDLDSLKKLAYAIGRAASRVDGSLGQNPQIAIDMLLGLFKSFTDFLILNLNLLTADEFNTILAPAYYGARNQAASSVG